MGDGVGGGVRQWVVGSESVQAWHVLELPGDQNTQSRVGQRQPNGRRWAGKVYVSEDYSGCWVKNRLEGRLELASSRPDRSSWASKQEVCSDSEAKGEPAGAVSFRSLQTLFEALSRTHSLLLTQGCQLLGPRLLSSSEGRKSCIRALCSNLY